MPRLTKKLRVFGPGLVVTAAAIGPGTVTTSSVSGATYGFALLWAVVFAVLASMVLQEMAARLGVETRQGLGEALATTFENPAMKALMVSLVISAITIGNAAYAGGDITGAAIGLQTLTGVSPKVWAAVIGLFMFALLATGRYRIVELALMALVGVMTVVFLVTAAMVGPDLGAMLAGMFVPSMPDGSLATIIALIGTTVVPYSLFLHASAVQEKWSESVPRDQALSEARLDTFFSLGLGGIITVAIVATSAAAFFGRGIGVENAGQMAEQLEPLLGTAAKYFFAAGLVATSLAAAVTGPLAASYATTGVLGWEINRRSWKFRAVWALIIVAGTVAAVLGEDPVALILFTQATNGILLPVIAAYLLVVMNRTDLLGQAKNGTLANVFGALVVLIMIGLGLYQFFIHWERRFE
jgi:manganese transport protein